MNLPSDFIKIIPLNENERSDFIESLNTKASTSIRMNPAKAKIFIEAKPVSWAENAYYLDNKPRYTSDPAFHAGAYYPQEAASMFIEKIVKQLKLNEKAIRVLDLCAAPGGKSTHLRSILHEESLLVCNEVIKTRAPTLADNLLKWGYTGTIVSQNDPRDFGRLQGFFDLVLVDAPCSGEGLFRKQPDAVEKWSLKNVELCALRQERILDNAWPALKEGGILIYSTCTYNSLENENNIQKFCSGKSSESLRISVDSLKGIEEVSAGNILGYRFMPHRVKSEGFFISAIRKHGKVKAPNYRFKKSLVRYENLRSSDPINTFVYTKENRVYTVQGSHLNDLNILQENLNIRALGLPVGKLVRDKFIPGHGLTMLHSIPMEFPEITCNLGEALTYLQKNDLRKTEFESQIIAVSFDGFSLGLGRGEKSRILSKYPKNMRILKAIPEAYTKLVDSL